MKATTRGFKKVRLKLRMGVKGKKWIHIQAQTFEGDVREGWGREKPTRQKSELCVSYMIRRFVCEE